MKRLLPPSQDVMIFAAAAVVLAAIAVSSHTPELVLAGISVPLFVACSVLGMWRTGRLSSTRSDHRRPN